MNELKQSQRKLRAFADHIQRGFGWIESNYIKDSWSNMFNEELDDEAIENVIEVLIYTYNIQVK